ncbi:hypothetical protein F511_16367 [Dorcoceras hygrometricum]|uniref:CRM domain-containing protein n=1 Tax=Dorcoceras hygrometricum TaxID=472368 RepID=A0A2Z7AIQ0_9LAMI|nr:hypothetical protein F511_16367 [Dorcoceras hygrometricum]
MIDRISQAEGILMNTIQSKALIGIGSIGEVPILLAKPQTYINFSGESVGPLAAYYQVPLRHILLVYDEMSLPNGVLRLQPKGGHGHHNGVKNVMQHLDGLRDFPRFCIGIGNPPGTMDMKAYLLQKFSPLERKQVDAALEQGTEAVRTLVLEGFSNRINRFNLGQKYKVASYSHNSSLLSHSFLLFNPTKSLGITSSGPRTNASGSAKLGSRSVECENQKFYPKPSEPISDSGSAMKTHTAPWMNGPLLVKPDEILRFKRPKSYKDHTLDRCGDNPDIALTGKVGGGRGKVAMKRIYRGIEKLRESQYLEEIEKEPENIKFIFAPNQLWGDGGYENDAEVGRTFEVVPEPLKNVEFGIPPEDVEKGKISKKLPWQREERMVTTRIKKEKVAAAAESSLDGELLRRLRSEAAMIKTWVKVKKAGVTEAVVNQVILIWRSNELALLNFDLPLCRNLDRAREIVELKTGGVVVWSKKEFLAVYRGCNYVSRSRPHLKIHQNSTCDREHSSLSTNYEKRVDQLNFADSSLSEMSHGEDGSLSEMSHGEDGSLSEMSHGEDGSLSEMSHGEDGSLSEMSHGEDGSLSEMSHGEDGSLSEMSHGEDGSLSEMSHGEDGSLSEMSHGEDGSLSEMSHGEDGSLSEMSHGEDGSLSEMSHGEDGSLSEMSHGEDGSLSEMSHGEDGSLSEMSHGEDGSLSEMSHGEDGSLSEMSHGEDGKRESQCVASLYERESDRLLDELGPRFVDWWMPKPLPVDADLLPEHIPGFKTCFRLCPPCTRSQLTDSELTYLRKIARPLPTHFVLGRNRKLQGLATAILKLWEKCHIAKIAVKWGVPNTDNEQMAHELKASIQNNIGIYNKINADQILTGGVLLLRNKFFIILYRGKDFLPSKVANIVAEREKELTSCHVHEETARLKASETFSITHEHALDSGIIGTLSEFHHIQSEVSKQPKGKSEIDVQLEAEQEKLEREIRDQQRRHFILKKKMERSSYTLEKLNHAWRRSERDADQEVISQEERECLHRVGLKLDSSLVLDEVLVAPKGRRGVFDGVIEGMHQHWKHREIVKVITMQKKFSQVIDTAKFLETESGGILVSIVKHKIGHAIIVYRGKNHKRPGSVSQNLLNNRDALSRSLEMQRTGDNGTLRPGAMKPLYALKHGDSLPGKG